MVEYRDDSSFSLDKELAASVKKILLKSIKFVDAQIPDEGDMFNQKYKPLNGRYNQQHGSSSSKATQVSKTPQNSSDDIPKPPIVLFPPEKVELGWKEMRRIGPGLANLGNTCFLNSVLQILTYTPPLVNYILSGHHKSKCRIVGFCMQCELASHINRALHNSQGGSIRPMSIIQKLQCIGKNFRFGRQEDAHEFLRYVVEGIQKSDYANRPKLDKLSKETTVANAIFGGFYRSQVKCMHCSYESNTFDPMMDLNLDIKDCSSIIQTLQKSVRPDRLEGDNKYFCEKCRTKRVAQKRGNIHKEPNVLTLVLKRFDFSKMFGGKISKDVSFSEELNIRPFMSNNHGEPVIYKLYGILVHSGYSCNSGHYYCYVKAVNGTWYEMNDSRVCQVGLQTVLRAQAYMLFYVKANQSKKAQKPSVNSVNQSVSNNSPKTPTNSQKNDVKPSSKESGKNSNESVGTSVKRKPEPKINWIQTQKEPLIVKSTTSLPSLKEAQSKTTIPMSSSNSLPSNSNKSVSSPPKKETIVTNVSNKPNLPVEDNKPKSKTSTPATKGTPSLSLPNPIAVKKFYSGTTMNSLQKLSEVYDDSDSVGSRASSPSSTQDDTTDDSSKSNTIKCKKDTKTDDKKANGKVTEISEKQPIQKSDVHESKPPFKLTLKNGKQFIHNKLNIWSPITKGTLYPRAIMNKCLSEHDGEHGKGHSSKRKKTVAPDNSSWKEEALTTGGRLFGPLNPPPPGPCSQESSSVTSETSSASSILNQSGEWDILEKGCDSPIIKPIENPSAGWKVSSVSKPFDLENETKLTDDSNNDDSKFLKKKKKKKKKRKHRSKEIFSGQVELKQKVCISIDKLSSSESLNDAKLKNTLTQDSKKKKMQLSSTISLPLIHSPTDDKHPKKHKKKKRRFSLTIDADTSNFEKLSKYISYEVKNEAKVTSAIETKELNGYTEKNGSDSRSDKVDYVNDKKETINDFIECNGKSDEKVAAKKEERLPHKKKEVPISSWDVNDKKETIYDDIECNGKSDEKVAAKKEERLPHKKKEVPIHSWDEQKKKQSTWDGSNKNDTIEHLLGAGPLVNSWDGSNKTYFYNIKKHSENTQDEWDEEYDKGKVKKKKRKVDDEYNNHKQKTNNFQDFQNYKNIDHNSKDKNGHRYSKHYPENNRHYNKKRKLYSQDNRFA